MTTVTYRNQPAIHATRGAVPLAGTDHLYTVKKVLWPKEVEKYLQSALIGRTIHVCCGHSLLGDVRLDLDPTVNPDIVCDAQDMSYVVKDGEFETVLIDMPYNGKFQWMHNVLSELPRIASKRIVFQQWYLPADKHGRYKKDHRFTLTDCLIWQPRTYFGRVNVVSIFDKTEQSRT